VEELALAGQVERIRQEAAVHLGQALLVIAARDAAVADPRHDLRLVGAAACRWSFAFVAGAGERPRARRENEGAPLPRHVDSFSRSSSPRRLEADSRSGARA